MDPVIRIASLTAILIFSVSVYLTPAIVARVRGHNSESAIAMLNILLGWSGLVWIVCLVWACTNDTREGDKERIVKEAALRRQLEIQKELDALKSE